MTTTHDARISSEDPSERALHAFEAAVTAGLAEDRPGDAATLLATAYVAAFDALRGDDGTFEVDEAWKLPGDVDWLRGLEVDGCTDVDSVTDALWQQRDYHLTDLLSEVVDEIEWLASSDDSTYGGFTSSGSSSFYALHHRGRTFWFHGDADLGDPYELCFAYEGDDPDGRHRMLLQLIKHLPAGSIDVDLSDAFDDAARHALRRAAEDRGDAPWESGFLSQDLANRDDEHLVTELVRQLDVSKDEALASLRRLRSHRPGEPYREFDRLVAWNICWPALGFRS